jgi:hypothetical protein
MQCKSSVKMVAEREEREIRSLKNIMKFTSSTTV